MSEEHKLHIDSDWKAQAEAERGRLAEADAQRQADKAEQAQEGFPPADLRGLVGVLATQALAGLGMYGDPKAGRIVVDFAGAKFAIDLLGVLEQKTKGNLTEEESKELAEIAAELRSRFVQLVQYAAAQSAQAGGAAPIAAAGSESTKRPASGLIIPG
ncbi:MAG: DUF1844 domain-containing protein [Planctomycetota bacterium]|nr:DUF1844 domain-containing protein [Planctomycetota bacterium]